MQEHLVEDHSDMRLPQGPTNRGMSLIVTQWEQKQATITLNSCL